MADVRKSKFGFTHFCLYSYVSGGPYLATEPLGKLPLKFSAPCVLSMRGSDLYHIVDQIFIGQSVGCPGNADTNAESIWLAVERLF